MDQDGWENPRRNYQPETLLSERQMTNEKVKHVTETDHVVDLEASDCGALIPNLFNRPAIPEHKKSIQCNHHKTTKCSFKKRKTKECKTKRKNDVIEMPIRGDQGGIRKCGAHTRILALGARYNLHYDQHSKHALQKTLPFCHWRK